MAKRARSDAYETYRDLCGSADNALAVAERGGCQHRDAALESAEEDVFLGKTRCGYMARLGTTKIGTYSSAREAAAAFIAVASTRGWAPEAEDSSGSKFELNPDEASERPHGTDATESAQNSLPGQSPQAEGLPRSDLGALGAAVEAAVEAAVRASSAMRIHDDVEPNGTLCCLPGAAASFNQILGADEDAREAADELEALHKLEALFNQLEQVELYKNYKNYVKHKSQMKHKLHRQMKQKLEGCTEVHVNLLEQEQEAAQKAAAKAAQGLSSDVNLLENNVSQLQRQIQRLKLMLEKYGEPAAAPEPPAPQDTFVRSWWW